MARSQHCSQQALTGRQNAGFNLHAPRKAGGSPHCVWLSPIAWLLYGKSSVTGLCKELSYKAVEVHGLDCKQDGKISIRLVKTKEKQITKITEP